jgi:hypothetical protein
VGLCGIIERNPDYPRLARRLFGEPARGNRDRARTAFEQSLADATRKDVRNSRTSNRTEYEHHRASRFGQLVQNPRRRVPDLDFRGLCFAGALLSTCRRRTRLLVLRYDLHAGDFGAQKPCQELGEDEGIACLLAAVVTDDQNAHPAKSLSKSSRFRSWPWARTSP